MVTKGAVLAYIDPQDSETGGRNKTLILVHGRGCKPAKEDLLALWRQALNAGVYRDGGDEQLVRLQQVTVASAGRAAPRRRCAV